MVRGEVETIDTFGVLPSDDGLPPLMFSRPTQFTKVDGGDRGAGATARSSARTTRARSPPCTR